MGDANHADSEAACVTSSIIKADLSDSILTLAMENYAYGAEPSVPSVTSVSAKVGKCLKDAEVKYYYSEANTSSGGAGWKDITGESLNAGTWYLYAVIPETANYNGYTTSARAFTVEKAEWTKTQVFGSANAGNEGSVDLTDSIAEGGSLGSLFNREYPSGRGLSFDHGGG